MVKTFKQFIEEGKQVGLLYHYTSFDRLLGILKSDVLYGDESVRDGANNTRMRGVSLTRDKNFHHQRDARASGILSRNNVLIYVSLVIDGDKLSNNYKIVPYTDYDWQYKDPMKNRIYNEMEEFVKGDIKNIKKYIKEIRIHGKFNKEALNKLKEFNIPVRK